MPKKFTFLILPEVHLLDLAGPNQVIGEAIDLGADFQIEYCGIDEAVSSSAGLGINNLTHFSKIKLKKGDYLIIPGSRVKHLQSRAFKTNKALFQWLRDVHEANVFLVSICVGAFVLGESGLLNRIECTTHFDVTEKLQTNFPNARVQENVLYTFDNNIYTSAGIASGIDLMLHILEKNTDGNFAHRVARELVVYKRRDGLHSQQSVYFQYRDHFHHGIHKVQDYLIENLDRKHYLIDLAARANMSERNFSRLFKKETGVTVNQFITNVRLEKIKSLIKSPDLSRKQIANRVGLQSEKQVTRLLKSVG
ncbi:GlxA family transcriptional regulator [Pseudochryseolinea flava]|uniref:AraC family transcriptional regulator n=1 Tax=Pseudochryseolinea flava TaxID=2059302 RepID=A0A364XZ96_9BACT|nr:DJ-1/PfpI family protein [Pseudochryseolinea flava]RAV98926.1 AraC family transcriptional regulator [Pseudochryseolinea flava]